MVGWRPDGLGFSFQTCKCSHGKSSRENLIEYIHRREKVVRVFERTRNDHFQTESFDTISNQWTYDTKKVISKRPKLMVSNTILCISHVIFVKSYSIRGIKAYSCETWKDLPVVIKPFTSIYVTKPKVMREKIVRDFWTREILYRCNRTNMGYLKRFLFIRTSSHARRDGTFAN